MVLTFYEGLLAEGRERRAEGRVLRAKRYIFPHFTRGLRLHRYFCVALRGFWQRAESEGRRVYFSAFYEGLTPPSLSKCRPKGLFCSGKTTSSSFSGNTGFSLPHTFWKKQIVRGGLTRRSPLRRKKACEEVDEEVNITERQIYN